MIIAKNCSLTYKGDVLALHPFDLQIRSGETVWITGQSGSGKTSLLKLMMGMVYPTQGSMNVLGCEMDEKNLDAIQECRQKIGPIFQDFKLMEERTVLENVMMGMRFLDFSPSLMKERSQSFIEKVGLNHRIDFKVRQLSWGERQRVAIARAISRSPQLIIADEPTGNLDLERASHVIEMLKKYNDHSSTLIITTHALHLIPPKEKGLFLHVDQGKITMERRL